MTEQPPTTDTANEDAPPAVFPIIATKPENESPFAHWFLAFERPELWLGYAALQFLLAVGSVQLHLGQPLSLTWQLMTAVDHMQCMLAAVWIAWGPGRHYYRIPLAIAWIVCETLMVGMQGWMLTIYCTTMFSSAAVAILLFTLARCLGGFQLWRDDKEPPKSHRLQYSLRHLLLLMAFVGILCVAGGILYDKVLVSFANENDLIEFAAFASLGVYWLVAQLPLPFVVLGLRRRVTLGIGIVGSAIWVVVWLPVGSWILDYLFGSSVGPVPQDLWITFAIVGMLSAGGMLGSLLCQRFMGYRLTKRVREGDAK